MRLLFPFNTCGALVVALQTTWVERGRDVNVNTRIFEKNETHHLGTRCRRNVCGGQGGQTSKFGRDGAALCCFDSVCACNVSSNGSIIDVQRDVGSKASGAREFTDALKQKWSLLRTLDVLGTGFVEGEGDGILYGSSVASIILGRWNSDQYRAAKSESFLSKQQLGCTGSITHYDCSGHSARSAVEGGYMRGVEGGNSDAICLQNFKCTRYVEDALDTSADNKHAAAGELGEVAADVERYLTASVHASNAAGGKDLHSYEGNKCNGGTHCCAAIALFGNDGADVPPGYLQRMLHVRVKASSSAYAACLVDSLAQLGQLHDQLRRNVTLGAQ
jgi:hypothetical protein